MSFSESDQDMQNNLHDNAPSYVTTTHSSITTTNESLDLALGMIMQDRRLPTRQTSDR